MIWGYPDFWKHQFFKDDAPNIMFQLICSSMFDDVNQLRYVDLKKIAQQYVPSLLQHDYTTPFFKINEHCRVFSHRACRPRSGCKIVVPKREDLLVEKDHPQWWILKKVGMAGLGWFVFVSISKDGL